MKIKQSVLAAAITAVFTFGASGQALAYVYGAAGLTVQDLQVTINPNGGSVVVNRFDFNLSNQATLNGNTVASTATCGGKPGASNNCTQTLGRMNAAVVNATGSSPTRTENQTTGGEFSFLGPNTYKGDFANADSWIKQAELVNLGSLTNTFNVAESLLNNSTEASGISSIQSITGFTISFDILGGPADFLLSFKADPDLRAAIFGESPFGSYSAQANLNTSITLTRAGGSGFVNWAPQGTNSVNDCNFSLVTSCTETNDTQNLNINVGTTTNNTQDISSWDPNALNLTNFGLDVRGLAAGKWSLVFNEVKSNQLARTAAVPEPGMLALLGIGLMGFGASALRRKRT